MNTPLIQRTHAHPSAYAAERHVYEALPTSERRLRSAASANYKAKKQGMYQSRELDDWLQAESALGRPTQA